MLIAAVVVGTALALFGTLAYTLRYFKTSGASDHGAEHNGTHPANHHHAAIAPHDHATTKLLKRFFDGKSCAVCERPIAPVHWTGRKPGLFDPSTGETHSWDEIPNENLSATLESQLPICAACEVAESFRQHHPELVVERRPAPEAVPARDRVSAGS